MDISFNRFNARDLRVRLEFHKDNIPNAPGVFRWWFPRDLALRILTNISDVEHDKIPKEKISESEYWCLYFGACRNLHQRIAYQLAQHHTPNAVKNGSLEILRQTLSGAMGVAFSLSENLINQSIDRCFCDWYETVTVQGAVELLKLELSSVYHPLNTQNNKVVPRSVLSDIKALRRGAKR